MTAERPGLTYLLLYSPSRCGRMYVQVPEMDRLEAIEKIRLAKQVQPVIVAVTASAMEEDREACIQAGMDDYISKPIRLDDLIGVIEKWAKG